MAREMRHSGIEWIGEIPKEWKVTKFKFMSEMYTGNSLNEHQKEYYSQYPTEESTLPYISTKDIERDIERINYDGEIRIPEFENVFSVAPANSVLLCIEGGSAGKKVGYTNQRICFVNKLCCINSKQYSRYLYFYILSNAFNEPFTQNIQGLIGGVSVNTLKNFYITTPSLPEQQKIANYLDKVCGEVDEMIALQEQMIEELKAYKQSVITEAVTKGLNPDVPMKDSGIDWIGEVPKHWDTGKTLYVLSMPITDGPHTTPDLFDDGVPFISADAVSDGYINFDNKRGFVSKEFYDECCRKYIPQLYDVYMIKSGASTGRTAIVETQETFTIWSPLAVFRANPEVMTPYYLLYMLRSDGYQKQVETFWSYGTQQNIGMRTLEKLFVCIPPLDEQHAIASYLDTKCSEIDSLIALKQAKIEELKEYKKSVIYEYVTGKKEVI